MIFQFFDALMPYIISFFILFQTNKPCKVERESYDGPVAKITSAVMNDKPVVAENPIIPNNAEFHNRPPTSSGARNLQDSTFSLSGQYFGIICILWVCHLSGARCY